ncbi:MAG: DUF3040 domain-containing protein [bacterium]|nr:DUF3040 domain-containing protein [bacterium]
MPLNERERQILEEIERQFRVEDPEFERKASSLYQPGPRFQRLPVAGFAIGLTLLGTFWLEGVGTVLALAGFVLMVVSVTALVQLRQGSGSEPSRAYRDFLSSARNSRWRFRR